MVKLEEVSNAQSWELEVTCKNRQWLDEVVKAILKYGMMEFEVNLVEGAGNHEGVFEGRYTVLVWCSWFNNLRNLTEDLAVIEKMLDGTVTENII